MKKRLFWLAIALLAALMIAPFLIPLPRQPDMNPEALAPGTGRFITVDGVKTHVQDIGPRDGLSVIFIHGFGGSTFSWRETLPFLATRGYRAVALDLKGFGLSDKRFEEDYGHPSQAAFVAGVMDELGVQRGTFAGHSMGASVMAHLAASYPERVDKLVFVDGAVRVDEDGANIDLVSLLIQFPPIRQWARFFMRWQLDEEAVAARLVTAYHDPDYVTDDVREGYLLPQRIKDWDLALLGITRDSNKNSLKQPLSEIITRPSLVIWGREDSWVPLSRGMTLSESLPDSELVVIPESGHLPMEEQAEAFNQALWDFLNQQPAP